LVLTKIFIHVFGTLMMIGWCCVDVQQFFVIVIVHFRDV